MCTLQAQCFVSTKPTFPTYLFQQKCSVLGNCIVGLPTVGAKHKTYKRKLKHEKEPTTKHQVTPGDFCCSPSHHYILHNFFFLHQFKVGFLSRCDLSSGNIYGLYILLTIQWLKKDKQNYGFYCSHQIVLTLISPNSLVMGGNGFSFM